ncbi:ER membrane protein complex subunit 4 [Fasciola hepatica]|uniref:ER membrane protein complex subunit 4 n=1 Tax=Fasciola hepatica TaxID=6192 RepID=A0A4E0RX29_FASHE|nr:ER membrane protein complex subunit 4 [Fasciola hepatica]
MDGVVSCDVGLVRDIHVNDLLSRKWNIDFTSRSRSTTSSQVPTSDLHPPGYVDRSFPGGAVRDSDPQLVIQRSWNIALGPLKQVPMNLFIMWISGNSISFFPLMSVIMLFLRPIQALFSIQTTFSLIEGSQAPMQRLVYVFGNFVMIALAMYKCHTMGLLPTYASDWLSFVEPPLSAEWSAGGQVI